MDAEARRHSEPAASAAPGKERGRFGAGAGPTPPGGKLSSAQARFLVLLGLPAFGLSLASTIVSTYLPVLIEEISGPMVTGLLIAGEGLFGLVLPLVLGPWSDMVDRRGGSRIRFLAVGAVLGAVALCLMPLVGTILGLALALVLFYVAYFTYYTPYWALYPDLVADGVRGRAVGLQGTWRQVGMAAAMVGGGVALALWRPLPFLVAAAVLAVVTLSLHRTVADARKAPDARAHRRGGRAGAAWRLLARRADIRALILANSLWELAVAALKAFVVLFFTVGLGRSLEFTSLVLALVAAASIVAAPASGWAADRFGDRRLIEASLWIFGLGLLMPFFTLSPAVFPLIPIVALAAVTLVTLPYSVLMRLMPRGNHGGAAGLFGFSHGVGALLGPLLAGVAIELSAPVLESTQGYLALFGVTSAAILLSIPLIRRIAPYAGSDRI